MVSITSGCIAGGVEALCVWPLEFIKASNVHPHRYPILPVLQSVPFLCVVVRRVADSLDVRRFLSASRFDLLCCMPLVFLCSNGWLCLRHLSDSGGKIMYVSRQSLSQVVASNASIQVVIDGRVGHYFVPT